MNDFGDCERWAGGCGRFDQHFSLEFRAIGRMESERPVAARAARTVADAERIRCRGGRLRMLVSLMYVIGKL